MGGKPRLVVHIGMHKTGSTSIQEALFRAREGLAARGVLYAATDRDLDIGLRHPKHGHLCEAAWQGGPERIAEAQAALVRQIGASGAHTVLVSEEGFSGAGPRAAEFFRPFTSDFEVEAICYLRRQDLFLESLFNQIVKRGRDEVELDIVSFAAAQKTQRWLNYLPMLRHWQRIGATVQVAEFDQARGQAGGLLAHFAEQARIEGVTLQDEWRNPSTDMQAVLALCARRRARQVTDEAALLRAAARLNTEGGVAPLRHLLGRRLRRELLERAAPMNERLAAEFGVHFPQALPEEGDEPLREPPRDYLRRLRAEMSAAAPRRQAPVRHAPPQATRCARVYVYTVPKAGTYLASAFVHRLGWPSSGWHIKQEGLLQTLEADDRANREEPSKAMVQQPFMLSFRRLAAGQHAFGHFCPMFLPFPVLLESDYRILSLHRHPRETLVSEFIDFRHRRRDVPWLAEAEVADHALAFERYLARHGPIVRNVFTEYLLFRKMSRAPEYAQLAGGDRVLSVAFRRFVDPATGPELALRMARFLGDERSADEVAALREQALAADNKTKATGLALPYVREALWTPAAEAIYADLGFDDLARRLGY